MDKKSFAKYMGQMLRQENNWPTCPKCGEKNVIVGPGRAACGSCSWIGGLMDPKNTEIWTYIKSRLPFVPLARFNAVAASCNGQHWAINTESTLSLIRTSMMEYCLVQLQRHFDAKLPFTMAALYVTKDSQVLVIPMDFTSRDDRITQMNALRDFTDGRHNIIIIYLQPDAGTKTGHICVNSFEVTMPPMVMHVPYSIQEGRVVMDLEKIPEIAERLQKNISWNDPPPLKGIMFQPVEWKAVPIVLGSIQPRYLGLIGISDEFGSTIYVGENLDGGMIAHVSTRDFSDHRFPVTEKKLNGTSAEECVAEAEKAFNTICGAIRSQGKDATVCWSGKWDIDVHPRKVLYDIREAPFWWEKK